MNAVPEYVKTVLRQLESAGHEAWCVGGCVRDGLLGRVPADWDVAASANPSEIVRCFPEAELILAGFSHGTVGVAGPEGVVEVTTYRIDGASADHRHPGKVRFSSSIKEDLRRRDFTVNAMAYHPERGLLDPFGGEKDLREKILRCVGEPERRFDEDALRMLRLLRFAAVLDFRVDPASISAALRQKDLLAGLSAQRVREELGKLLCGKALRRVLEEGGELVSAVLPEVEAERVIDVLEAVPPEESLRWAALFRDCREEMAREILSRLRFSKKKARSILRERSGLRGEERMSRSQLAINGGDLMALGFSQGEALGRALDVLLGEVEAGRLPNQKEELLRRAGELF